MAQKRYETVILEKPEEGIGKITLNRPESRNAFNWELREDLAAACADVARDDDIRVLIVTGAGSAFSSGGDVRVRERRVDLARPEDRMTTQGPTGSVTAEGLRRGFENAQRFIVGFQRMEKPTIAMVNGPAVAGGFCLAAACDLRVGCPDSRFRAAYILFGLFPGFGGTWLYPRALGSIPKAAELIFTGDWLDAEEAYRFGLLNKLVPRERLEEETMALARKIAQGPPIAMRLSKLMLYRGLEFDLETAMLMAAAAETITLTSEDHREGVKAFRERRKPVYRGR